jgi:hypothetical protein
MNDITAKTDNVSAASAQFINAIDMDSCRLFKACYKLFKACYKLFKACYKLFKALLVKEDTQGLEGLRATGCPLSK